MKIKLFFTVVISIFMLSSCQSEKESFTKLFNEAVNNFYEADSYKLEETVYYNYKTEQSELIKNRTSAITECINSPYYSKTNANVLIHDEETDIKQLILQGESKNSYILYTDYSTGGIISDVITKDDLENPQLEIALRIIPKSVKVIDTKRIHVFQKEVTYEATFTLNDLAPEDKVFLDEYIQFFFDPLVDTSSSYKDIKITETITINKTKKQLVEINFNIERVIAEVLRNQSINVNDSEGSYYFKFSNFNEIKKDADFINDMKEEN